MIKKILNKVFYAVVIALVFAFINRGCAKALGEPFYTTGKLDFNIVTKDSSDNYIYSTQTRDYDFSLLLEQHESDFNNYNYFFITLYTDNSSFSNYLIELYFTDSVSTSCGSSTFTGSFKRYRYLTNYNSKTNGIFDSSNVLTTTSQQITDNRTGIPILSYYKVLNFYGQSPWSNYVSNFNDLTNIPLINYSYSSPSYFVPWGTASSYTRSLIFSNWSGSVCNVSSVGSLSMQNYDYYIGEPTETIDYSIEFSAINSTNNSQEIFGNDNTITGGGIAIKYTPLNNELYNYYYYWEKDEGQEPIGNPNDITDWEQLDSSDKGIGVVVVDSNGWLYAKITDKNGNMLANNVLNYKSYGKTSLFPASYVKTDTWLGKFAEQINYGGPINSIITVPINLLNTLFQSFGGTCQSFNMGAILGKNITFNCFTLQSILGSSITNVIDMLCSFFIYYHLLLFIISIYRKIMNLDDLDDYLPQHLYHPKHGDYNDYNF